MPPRPARTLAFVSLLVAGRVVGAQQASAPPDSAAIPTVAAAQAGVSGAAKPKSRDWLPVVFYGTVGAAAATSLVLHIDADPGGYHDGWSTETDFPDKAVHALAAWALTNVGIDLGARPRHSALAVCAAGTAFEFAQGYVSVYDIVADCAGAAGAAAWQSWRAHRRRARAARAPATPATH
jgi:hypothetical protein